MDQYIGRAWSSLSEGASTSFGALAPNRSSLVPVVIAAIIGIALIVVVIITIVQMQATRPKVAMTGPLDLYSPKSPIIISRAETKSHMRGSYTLAFYMRIDAVPDMRAGATPLFTWPGAWNMNYNVSQEQLEWAVTESPSLLIQEDPSGQPILVDPIPEIVSLPKVPMQRWVQVTLAFEGRSMDLYVNGALIRSHILTNTPNSSDASVTIVANNVHGQIAYIQLWPRRLTVKDVDANFVDTSDSQGRPYLGPEFLSALTKFSLPNLFCPSGDCTGSKPAARPSQTWEFPYA